MLGNGEYLHAASRQRSDNELLEKDVRDTLLPSLFLSGCLCCPMILTVHEKRPRGFFLRSPKTMPDINYT